MGYREHDRAELEVMCIDRGLLSDADLEAVFTREHLAGLLERADASVNGSSVTDIKWRTPDEMKWFLAALRKADIILLTESPEGAFETLLVSKEGSVIWSDAPLASFSCPVFDPDKYVRLAVVAMQSEP